MRTRRLVALQYLIAPSMSLLQSNVVAKRRESDDLTLDSLRTDIENSMRRTRSIEHTMLSIGLAANSTIELGNSKWALQKGQNPKDHEFLAALKSRCSAQSKLLQYDYSYRKLWKKYDELDLAPYITNEACNFNMKAPLVAVALKDDVFNSMDELNNMAVASLNNSVLTVSEFGEVYAKWAVPLMSMPLTNSYSAPSCFIMKYMGSKQPFCAESEAMRDRWMNALAQNSLCLEENVGLQKSAVFEYFNLPTKDDSKEPEKDKDKANNNSSSKSSSAKKDAESDSLKKNKKPKKDSLSEEFWIALDEKGIPTLYDELPPPRNVTNTNSTKSMSHFT